MADRKSSKLPKLSSSAKETAPIKSFANKNSCKLIPNARNRN